jgi:hypothetical protein
MSDATLATAVALGPEWRTLELLTVGLRDEERRREFLEILGHPHLSWGELLEQALRHKMLPALAVAATAEDVRSRLPRMVCEHFTETAQRQRYKLGILRREAARIAEALQAREARFVATKGIVFESTLYRGNGGRHLSDIDFMIDPAHREVVPEVLAGLGYEMGYYDWRTDGLHRFTRKELIAYQLHADHLPSFTLLTSDPVVTYVSLDFATSLTWARCEFEVPIEHALAERDSQPIPGHDGVRLPIFTPDFQFLFTVLHLFREAWLEKWLDLEQDVNLMKFADLLRLWEDHREMLADGRFLAKVERYGVLRPLLWVLEHLDRTFGTRIVGELGLEGRTDESWLASAGGGGGGLRLWHGDMRKRLSSKDRRNLFEA